MESPATGRDGQSRSEGNPYDDLDVDPYGRTDARVDTVQYGDTAEPDGQPLDPHAGCAHGPYAPRSRSR